ncbi:hypothetical protein MSG_00781 [Mycobacterium shigaense]|uniref:Uncharacterized protein n=1 Tax=Mycobacterium shigaense TaxID=722731 RepID=A0A1Z4EDB3_9MYCO|nr:hypothetical protein MSG_00781 [Mycobacterium shigaense]
MSQGVLRLASVELLGPPGAFLHDKSTLGANYVVLKNCSAALLTASGRSRNPRCPASGICR